MCGCTNNEELSYSQIVVESSEVVNSRAQMETVTSSPKPSPSPTPTPLTETSELVDDEEVESDVSESVESESITFRISAYCACEYCCGEYAINRPTDENGNPIVYGASGNTLVSGVSCASPLPFGTTIELDGYGTVVVEDRTADWIIDEYGYYILDLYFDNHQTACEWGVKFIDGVILQ